MLEELNTLEMNEIKGGISQQEYCDGLHELMQNNWHQWSSGEQTAALQASLQHCITQEEQEVIE